MTRIDTGIKRTKDGIEEKITVESYLAQYPYVHNMIKVIGNPTTKGKRSTAYREVRAKLGDDWVSDITDNWYMDPTWTVEQVRTISNAIDSVR
jgi:hypothetical protein